MRVVRLLLCVLFGCLGSNALAREAVSVQLIWKHQFEFAAFYAAQAMGYYRDAGLSVTIKEGGPGIDAVREVTQGRADFGVGTSSLVVERAQGAPVVVLATLMQHSPIALLARRTARIDSVSDLAGRPVAVDPHSRDEIEAYLLASGIKKDQIRLVDQPDWTLDSLDRGQIAAKAVYVSNEPFLVQARAHDYLLLTARSAGIDLFGNMLFSSEAMLKARPEVVRAFREATLKGMVYALDHPGDIAELIIARYNTQHKTRAHLLFEAEKIRELTRPDIVEPGYMSRGRWRHVVSVYASQGKIAADFDLDGFLYDPNPKPVPSWLIWVAFGTTLALVLSWAVLARMQRINQRLHREVAERKQAERALNASEAKYRELVENANAIIIRMDMQGTIIYFNEVAEKVFGYRADDVLNRGVVGTIVPEVESGTRRDLSAMIEGLLEAPEHYGENENENITRDGRRIWVRWSNRVIRDGADRATGLLSIGHDITAEHQLEQELEQHHRHLEAKVVQRTSELVTAKLAAEHANQAKNEFLAQMSHELRTPLHAILAYARMGSRRSAKQDFDKIPVYFSNIGDSAERLSRLVDDLLDLSRLESGEIALFAQTTDLRHLTERVVEEMSGLLADRGIRVAWADSPGPADTLCDAQRIHQVLVNVLGNAIKFSPPGSTITLQIRETTGSRLGAPGEELTLEVRDQGPGIPPDELESIFWRFTQSSATRTGAGGSGLGLSIAQGFMHLHHGELLASNNPDGGACFTLVFLPASRAVTRPVARAGH
ncbi:ABC transporter substrate-binding protein [Nitrogeniibacter mangrovi]|uniref:histidine kinase n=1 Tax=Nitrogeniibacter mangrovi TaxID=2016596 RepID=A0A6C1B6X7_9RHOO|nr:ABC transporter substrate-binding protein [Nitrogeniibacter mangrovi]QID19227.1 ABC transporter substrate-binding protein [Nitrogeniibacter mangrovi]